MLFSLDIYFIISTLQKKKKCLLKKSFWQSKLPEVRKKIRRIVRGQRKFYKKKKLMRKYAMVKINNTFFYNNA